MTLPFIEAASLQRLTGHDDQMVNRPQRLAREACRLQFDGNLVLLFVWYKYAFEGVGGKYLPAKGGTMTNQ